MSRTAVELDYWAVSFASSQTKLIQALIGHGLTCNSRLVRVVEDNYGGFYESNISNSISFVCLFLYWSS
jgi:hypothetical protein